VLNFCANNYLGLAGDERPDRRRASRRRTSHGAGTASVRFICGTLEMHKELEQARSPTYLGFAGHHPVRGLPSTPTAACSSRCSGERGRHRLRQR
jgi:hypothetical protein